MTRLDCTTGRDVTRLAITYHLGQNARYQLETERHRLLDEREEINEKLKVIEGVLGGMDGVERSNRKHRAVRPLTLAEAR